MKLLLLESNLIRLFKKGKFYFTLFFCSLFVLACNKTGNNKVDLFNDYQYLLVKGEKNIQKNQNSIKTSNRLKSIFNKNDIILYKHIYHKNYNTFLFLDLDSFPKTDKTYLKKKDSSFNFIYYKHMLNEKSEIISITQLKDNNFHHRFSKDSLSKNRFLQSK